MVSVYVAMYVNVLADKIEKIIFHTKQKKNKQLSSIRQNYALLDRIQICYTGCLVVLNDSINIFYSIFLLWQSF